MRCSEAVKRCVLGLVCLAAASLAEAHKSSDAYLQIDARPSRLAVRWDIALRDLDVALDLDSDADGKLTWGEVRAAWPRIEAYAVSNLAIAGCPLLPDGRALERRNDGAYAVLLLHADCDLPSSPSIRYSLFAELDPTHRGIAKVQRPGQEVRLSVLEPVAATRLPSAAQASSASASAGGDTSSRVDAAQESRWQFLAEGVRHILGGYDHVLFLLCLLLPSVMRRTPAGWQPVDRMAQAVWPVVGIVSAFTVAHSITLCLAALKIVSLSSSFIEPAIAATIALAALDNLWPFFPVRRVVVTFFFGLVHGFGFAAVLAELNLPQAAFAWALLQFNVGLELGQLAIVAVVTTLFFTIRRWPGYARVVIGGGSAAAIVLAALWFVERTANVSILGS
ncbi:MAG: HupE/UreJ family protein [Caldimonas sp.]